MTLRDRHYVGPQSNHKDRDTAVELAALLVPQVRPLSISRQQSDEIYLRCCPILSDRLIVLRTGISLPQAFVSHLMMTESEAKRKHVCTIADSEVPDDHRG